MQNLKEAVIGNAITERGEEESAADETTAKQNNVEAKAMCAAEKVAC